MVYLLHSFGYAGHCRDSDAKALMTGVDWPHEFVRVYPWAHEGVFRRVCQRPFGTVCTVRTWLGDVVSYRDRHGLAASAFVPSLWIRLSDTWSFTPPRRLARRILGHLPPPRRLTRRGLSCPSHLANSLGEDLVVRPAS
jgi:hypothetical protein